MQIFPPIDPKKNALGEVLAARGLTADWLNADDGEPYGPHNMARYCVAEAAKTVPFSYADALLELPELRTWNDELIAAARKEQDEERRVIAAVRHGRSMLLLGPTGVGKTYQAYGAVRDLAVTGVKAIWTVTTVGNLYAALQPRYGIDSETEFRRYAYAQILLLDDLGAGGKVSEFTENVNFRLINHRYEHGLPTLFTTNVPPKELAGKLGDRCASRLTEMCQRVVVTGPDRRRRGEAA